MRALCFSIMSEEKGDGYLDIGQSEPSEEVGLTQLFHTRYILRAHSLLCRSLQKVRATPHIRNALCGNREEKKKKKRHTIWRVFQDCHCQKSFAIWSLCTVVSSWYINENTCVLRRWRKLAFMSFVSRAGVHVQTIRKWCLVKKKRKKSIKSI